MRGEQRQTIRGRHPVSSKPILTPKVIREAIRRTGSEAIARADAGQSWPSMSRSKQDYAARGELGDPRGRKSGGGSGTGSPTFPTRAEGGKRFRSAIRNP